MRDLFRIELVWLIAIGTSAGIGAGTPAAEEVHRQGWVPGVGAIAPGEIPLGDVWIFECPRGGTFDLEIDTTDDTDGGAATLDPVVVVLDGRGDPVAVGDDEVACTHPPVCGGRCPALEEVACGRGAAHSIIVRDFGDASTSGEACAGGGGYQLRLEVIGRNGTARPAAKVALGGGPAAARKPGWLRRGGFPRQGPLIDDAGVPANDRRGTLLIGAEKAGSEAPDPGDDVTGDLAAGEQAFRQCRPCHVPDREENRVGPHLVGIFGRPAGSIPYFTYSDAMRNSGIVWNQRSLPTFLADPRGLVPGTTMAFAGIDDSQEIRDLLAYLQAVSTPD